MRKQIAIVVFTILSTACFGADYYWIGGSGNWSDISHWATTSGGNVTHPQVPTSEDNVIFDGNSFSAGGQSVILNNEIIFVNDFDLSAVTVNANIIGTGANALYINGRFVLSSSLNFNYSGSIIFTGGGDNKSVDFAGDTGVREVSFAGDGSWVLNNRLDVDSLLRIERGTLNTNNQEISTKFWDVIDNGRNKALNLTTSEILITGAFGDREFWDDAFDTIPAKFSTSNVTIDPGSSVFRFTADDVRIWFQGNGSIDLNDFIVESGNSNAYFLNFRSEPSANLGDVTLNGSGKFEGNLSFNNLVPSKSKLYSFQSGRTYALNNILFTDGDCGGGITIISDQGGNATNFQTPNNMNLSYVTLKDVHINMGTHVIDNSVDLGNNQGWTFNEKAQETFYWVNNSGDWSDPTHWALTSGGPSSGCVPTGKDNAIFDENSFSINGQEVEINQEDIFIRDMLWTNVTNNPDLTGNLDNSMHVTGSLRMDENMAHTFGGYYFLESEEMGNTIEMNGKQFNRELVFSGNNGEWTVLDDIYVVWNITLNSGSLITGNNEIEAWQFLSNTENNRILNITNSHFIFHDIFNQFNNPIYQPSWIINTNNISFTSSNSKIEYRSGIEVRFENYGAQQLQYNTVLFNAYSANISSNNQGTQRSVTTVDSMIINGRSSTNGDQDYNYWFLRHGHENEFFPNLTVFVNELDIDGECDGFTILSSIFSESPFNISCTQTTDIMNLYVSGSNSIGSGTLTAMNSIDNGNNSGWNFTAAQGRTLYWVNDGGEWEDPSHWSLTSGGVGGECIPTSIDDVIFDGNSFSTSSPSVYSNGNKMLFCHDITIIDVPENLRFGSFYDNINDIGYFTDRISVHGTISFHSLFFNNLYWWHLSTTETDSVFTRGQYINGIYKEGSGTNIIADDLVRTWSFDVFGGSLIFDDVDIHNSYFYAGSYYDQITNIDFRRSNYFGDIEGAFESQFVTDVTRGTFTGDDANFQFDTQVGRLLSTSMDIEVNNITFTNNEGNALVGDRYIFSDNYDDLYKITANKIEFNGNGEFYGKVEADSLIGVAGKTYTFESQSDYQVNRYLQFIGNNCTPINVRSSIPGTQANLMMPAGSEIVVDFVEMQDNNASGGADFIAGARSTDVNGSNSGWTFEDPPEFVETGFLGEDRALCNGNEVTLDAYNFSPNEQYTWSDGSSDSSLVINQPGIYSVEVVFGNGCTIQDEVEIYTAQDVSVDILSDTIICENTSFTLDGSVPLAGATYVWDDGSTEPERMINAAGTYVLSVEVDGCVSNGMTEVGVQELPTVDLGDDRSFCENTITTLDASFTGAEYLWQDGAVTSTYEVSTPGIYSVEVSVNGCGVTDSVVMSQDALPIIEFNFRDTTFCADEMANLSTSPENGVDYLWQDGSVSNTISITSAGTYRLLADRNGCSFSDSVEILIQELPVVELGQNRSFCENTTIALDVTNMGASYLWQDGSTSSTFTASTAGTYEVSVDLNGCIVSNSVVLDQVSLPIIDFNAGDTTLCNGQSFTLTTSMEEDVMYTWQDGAQSNSINVSIAGLYRLIADRNGCTAVDSISVMTQEAPEFELGENIITCEGETINLQTTTMADSYNWSDGATTASTSITMSGIYTLQIVVGECTLRDSLTVDFVPFPEVDLGMDTSLCDGDQLELATVISGEWQDGTVTDRYTVSEPGLYRVILDNQGCISTDSVNIEFRARPVFDLGEPINSCVGEIVELIAPSNISNYSWEDGTSEAVRTITSSGVYTLTAIENDCDAMESIEVMFFDLPEIDLGFDTVACDDAPFILNPFFTGDLLWEDGTSGNTFSVTEPGIITASVTQNGCTNTDSVLVEFRECAFFDAFFPNVFSPNGDGNNEVFNVTFPRNVIINSFKMSVYDRWGGKMYETFDKDIGWDGLFNSQQVPVGVYIYSIEVNYTDDLKTDTVVLNGDVLVATNR